MSGTTWLIVWIENAAAGSRTYTLSEGTTAVGSTATTSNGPVSLGWPTTGGPNGTRTVTVSVRDAAGNTGTASRTVTVANGGGGPIRVFITAPASGAAVRGTVWFTVWIEGATAGSRSYTLAVGGTAVASTSTTSSGPVSLAWPTTAAHNGSRTAAVTVRDSAGNTGTASLTANVAN